GEGAGRSPLHRIAVTHRPRSSRDGPDHARRGLAQPVSSGPRGQGGPAPMTVTGYSFRLYLAGGTARAMQAEAQLRHLCETRLPEGFELEVLDVTDHPDRA